MERKSKSKEDPKKKLKTEEDDKDKKKKKKEEHEEKENNKDEKSESEEAGELVIDTKGDPIIHEPGGQLLVQCMAVRDTGKKPSQFAIEILLDQTSMYKSKQPSSGVKWELETEQLQQLATPPGAKILTVVLKEKGLVGLSYKGEVRMPMEHLYDGYPHHSWFDLQNKEGKEKKLHGALHLKIQYIGKSQSNMDVFKYPLHSLINMNRMDIFQKKIDDLKLTEFSFNDKKQTPLILAASDGKVGFVKLLIENKANIEEKTKDDFRTALHWAAIGGHVDVIRYLASLGGLDMDAPDSTDLEQTPLHLAAENNKPEACKWLIKCGANPNIKNKKGNTPLADALQVQQPSAAHLVIQPLIKKGSDIYIENNDKLAVWDIAQRKDLCYSTTTRSAFMKATDSIDRREFQIMRYTGQKQRLLGKNLSKDWSTSTQWILTVDKATKTSILAYSDRRTENCEKLVAFCLVQCQEYKRRMPSFQQEGIGFGSFNAFDVDLLPGNAYTVIAYCTDDSVMGDFGICVFTKPGTPKVKSLEACEWAHHVHADGGWRDETAGGSGSDVLNNEKFIITNKSKESAQALVMLRQVNKSIDSLVFADGGHRITPSKYYVGFFIYDEKIEEVVDQTDKWINSYDVYKKIDLEGLQSVVIVPTTQKEGEEMDYEIHVFSDTKFAIKKVEDDDEEEDE